MDYSKWDTLVDSDDENDSHRRTRAQTQAEVCVVMTECVQISARMYVCLYVCADGRMYLLSSSVNQLALCVHL